MTPRFKCDLPNYGVFDEKRVFTPGPMPEPVNFRGTKIGVPVCEDIWTSCRDGSSRRCGGRVLSRTERFAVRVGKVFDEGRAGARRARVRPGAPLAYVNRIGGQDELVFDGRSFVVDRNGELVRSHDRMGGIDRRRQVDAHRRRMDLRARRPGTGRRRARGHLQRAHRRLARLCRQERFSGNRARVCRAASTRR